MKGRKWRTDKKREERKEEWTKERKRMTGRSSPFLSAYDYARALAALRINCNNNNNDEDHRSTLFLRIALINGLVQRNSIAHALTLAFWARLRSFFVALLFGLCARKFVFFLPFQERIFVTVSYFSYRFPPIPTNHPKTKQFAWSLIAYGSLADCSPTNCSLIARRSFTARLCSYPFAHQLLARFACLFWHISLIFVIYM